MTMMIKVLPLAILAAMMVSACSTNSLSPQSVDEKRAEVFYERGTSELVNKNYQSALSNLLEAKKLTPKNSKVRNNLGMAYYFRDQVSLAEVELKEAIDLDKGNSDARLNLGSILMEKNQLKEARELFVTNEKDLLFVNQHRNYYNLALLNLKEGDRREAFIYLSKSVKERNDYCQAHYKLGELYYEEYKFKQAYDSFKEAGKGTCVSEPAPHYQMGMALMNMNRSEDAKRKFQEVMEKFSSTRFATLSSVQIKKLSQSQENQSQTRANTTEIIQESPTVETPNF